MLTKKLLASLVLAVGTIGAAMTPLASSAETNIEFGFGAPAPHYEGYPAHYEAYPAHRPGYVWVPGYRAWDGYRYVWYRGHWERARGYAYRDYGYRDGYRGYRARVDSDGDGVPDRFDARPHNPYRY